MDNAEFGFTDEVAGTEQEVGGVEIPAGVFSALEMVNGQLVPTQPMFELHGSGTVIAATGCFVTTDNKGNKIAMNSRDGWVAPDPQVLFEAIRTAKLAQPKSLPVLNRQRRYQQGWNAFGYLVVPQDDLAYELGCDMSPAIYRNKLGQGSTKTGKIVGVFTIQAQAYGQLLAERGLIPLHLGRATAGFDVTPLAEGLEHVREHGVVSELITYPNGDQRQTMGFPRANQREEAEAEIVDDALDFSVGVSIPRPQTPQNVNSANGNRRSSSRDFGRRY